LDEIIGHRVMDEDVIQRRMIKHVFQLIFLTWIQDLRCRLPGQRVFLIPLEE
jgi:hypothetical protein